MSPSGSLFWYLAKLHIYNLARYQIKFPEDDILNVETCISLTIHKFIIFIVICAFVG